jgi:hypothetical protein
MKKNLFIATILCGSCICANAASMVTEWTGNAGPTEGNTYELGNADNWSNGVPARGNNQGPDVIFNNTGTITLSGGHIRWRQHHRHGQQQCYGWGNPLDGKCHHWSRFRSFPLTSGL